MASSSRLEASCQTLLSPVRGVVFPSLRGPFAGPSLPSVYGTDISHPAPRGVRRWGLYGVVAGGYGTGGGVPLIAESRPSLSNLTCEAWDVLLRVSRDRTDHSAVDPERRPGRRRRLNAADEGDHRRGSPPRPPRGGRLLSGTRHWLQRGYLLPTTIESGPSRCSTEASRNPTSFIQPMQSAPV